MVIAIDFDGTITEQSFPEVGALKKDADIYIRRLWSEGHAIVINTCRSGKYEGMAEDFLRANDIPFSYINSNMPHLIVDYGQDCRKISADVYIDDRCLMGLPETWEEIYNMVQKINQKKIV